MKTGELKRTLKLKILSKVVNISDFPKVIFGFPKPGKNRFS